MILGMFALFFAFPSVGLGFCLQGLMRLRNATILLTGATLALWLGLGAAYGIEKVQSIYSLFATMLLLFCPLFGLGWHLGTRDAKRRTHQPA